MTEHDTEYQALLAKTAQRDRESIIAHWELGALFARYGEPVTGIAGAIGRSVTYVADHLKIAQVIPTREALDQVLTGRDDIQVWTVLVDWVKAGGPGQESEAEPDANDISRARRHPKAPPASSPPAGGRGTAPSAGPQRGGIQLLVPAHIIKGLADLGVNPREAMALFWQNVAPMLIVNVAYPGRTSQEHFASGLAAPFAAASEPAQV